MDRLVSVLLPFVVFFSFGSAQGDRTEVLETELARESVTPVFVPSVSVKNRRVVTEKKFEIGASYGMALTEPIANVSKIALAGYYHPTENSAWGLFYSKNSTGLSEYANQLNKQFSLDFNRAPKPDYSLMGDYNAKFFYGKMSLTKGTVFNIHIFGSGALGMVKYQHKSYPALALGLGQKFYFNERFSFRFDLRLYAHQAPIPFKPGALKTGSSPDPVPAYDSFSERMTYTTVLDLGLNFLF